jgi:hypothetical protein
MAAQEQEQQFENAWKRLHHDWRHGDLSESSNTAAVRAHAAFREIVALGAGALPLVVAKLREGEFVLNQAMSALTGFELPPASESESEQALARRWVLWWEGRQTKMAEALLGEWLAENQAKIDRCVIAAVRRLAGVPELLVDLAARETLSTETKILAIAKEDPARLGQYVAEEFEREFAQASPGFRSSLTTLAAEIAQKELWNELRWCVQMMVRHAA